MFELSQEHEDFRTVVRDFAEKEVAPHIAQWDRDRHFPADLVPEDGRPRPVRPRRPGGVRRRGERRLHAPLRRDRGARPRRPVHRHHALAPASASASTRSSPSAPRSRSSASCPTSSPAARSRLRPDRARGRLRRRRHPHPRRPRRRRVGRQRRQGVHHQLRHRHHVGRHRHRPHRHQRRRLAADLARSSCPPARPASSSSRPTTSSAGTPPTPTASPSRTAASRPTTCSARRGRASSSSSRPSTTAASPSRRSPSAAPRPASSSPPTTRRPATAFGRPIGANQGVAFQLADLAVMVEGARPADLQGGLAQGRAPRRPALGQGGQAGRRDRQALLDRGRRDRHPHRHPGLRRQRLHGGVPRRPVLPRRQDPRDRRGHLRGAADGHRPRAGPAGMTEPHPPVSTSPTRGSPTSALGCTRHTTTSGKRADKAQAKLDAQSKIYVRDRIAPALRRGLVRRGRPLRQRAAAGSAGRRRRHRPRHGRRPAGDRHRQRPDRQGRLVGRAHRREDRPRHRDRRCARSCRSSGSSTRPGARITDQVEMFPGRRGAGRIFHNQVALSGKVPQICCLFGPSAAGGAYIPRFCRPHHHGRGQRVDVPRQPADGRDGRR